jgi:hypothetical protein
MADDINTIRQQLKDNEFYKLPSSGQTRTFTTKPTEQGKIGFPLIFAGLRVKCQSGELQLQIGFKGLNPDLFLDEADAGRADPKWKAKKPDSVYWFTGASVATYVATPDMNELKQDFDALESVWKKYGKDNNLCGEKPEDPKDPETEQDRQAQPKVQPCECPECFDQYASAIGDLVGNIKKILPNRTIESADCPDLSKQKDPGCMRAPFLQLGTGRDNVNDDAFVIQPSQRSTVTDLFGSRPASLVQQEKEFIENFAKEFNSNLGSLTQRDGIANFANNTTAPKAHEKLSHTKGRWRYSGQSGIISGEGGCKSLIASLQGKPPYTTAGVARPSLDWASYRTLSEWCCMQEILEDLRQGGFQKFGGTPFTDLRLECGVDKGTNTDPCVATSDGKNGVITLPKDITCCLDSDKIHCPEFKCCKSKDSSTVSSDCKDSNKQEFNKTIASLNNISSGGDSGSTPTCLDELLANLKQVLFGPANNYAKGMYYILWRAMLITKFLKDSDYVQKLNNNDIARGPGKVCPSSVDGQGKPTGPGCCTSRLLGLVGGDGPAKKGWNDEKETDPNKICLKQYGPDIVASKESYELGYRNAVGGEQECDIPYVKLFKITDLNLGFNNNERLAIIISELIEKFKRIFEDRFGEIIKKVFEEADIDLTDPSVDDKRCQEDRKTLQRLQQDLDNLKKVIDGRKDLLAEQYNLLNKTKQDKEQARKEHEINKRDSKGFPELPKINPGEQISQACRTARSDYLSAKNNYLSTQRAYEDALLRIRTLQEDKSILNDRLVALNNHLITISTRPDGTLPQNLQKLSGVNDMKPPVLPGDNALRITTKQAMLQRISEIQREIKNRAATIDNDINQLKALTDPNGTLSKNVVSARKRLAEAAKEVKDKCNYRANEFDADMPEDLSRTLPFDPTLYDMLIEGIENSITETENTIEGLEDKLYKLQDQIENLKIQIDINCSGDKAKTASACFMRCFNTKIQQASSSIFSVNLDEWLNNINEKDNFCTDDKDGGEDEENKHPLFKQKAKKLFNETLTPEKIRQTIADILNDCLQPDDQQSDDDDKDCKDRIEQATKRKEARVELRASLVQESNNKATNIQQSATERVVLSSGQEISVAIDSSGINGILDDITASVNHKPNPTYIPSQIRDRVLKLTYNSELNKPANRAVLGDVQLRLMSELFSLARTRIQIRNLDDSDEFDQQIIDNCTNRKLISCNDILIKIKDNVQSALQANGEKLRKEILDQALELLRTIEEPGKPNDLTMGNIKRKLLDKIREEIKKDCPDTTEIPGNPNFAPPGGGQPQVPAEPFTIDDISIICEDNKIIHILVKYKVFRRIAWNSPPNDGGYGGFNVLIREILNSTIICKDDPRPKSIFHDSLYKLMEGVDDLANIDGLGGPGNRKQVQAPEVGPKWLPDLKPGGPYFYPPPNPAQVETGSIDRPCPKHCGQMPKATTPNQRISIIKRLVLEGRAIYEYLGNVLQVVQLTKEAIEEIYKGLESCSEGKNYPQLEGFDDTEIGRSVKNLDKPIKANVVSSVLGVKSRETAKRRAAIRSAVLNTNNTCDGCGEKSDPAGEPDTDDPMRGPDDGMVKIPINR